MEIEMVIENVMEIENGKIKMEIENGNINGNRKCNGNWKWNEKMEIENVMEMVIENGMEKWKN